MLTSSPTAESKAGRPFTFEENIPDFYKDTQTNGIFFPDLDQYSTRTLQAVSDQPAESRAARASAGTEDILKDTHESKKISEKSIQDQQTHAASRFDQQPPRQKSGAAAGGGAKPEVVYRNDANDTNHNSPSNSISQSTKAAVSAGDSEPPRGHGLQCPVAVSSSVSEGLSESREHEHHRRHLEQHGRQSPQGQAPVTAAHGFSFHSSIHDSGRHLTQEQLRALYEEQKTLRQPRNPREREISHRYRSTRAYSEPPLTPPAASSTHEPHNLGSQGDHRLQHLRRHPPHIHHLHLPANQTAASDHNNSRTIHTEVTTVAGTKLDPEAQARATLLGAEGSGRDGDRGRAFSVPPELQPRVLHQEPPPILLFSPNATRFLQQPTRARALCDLNSPTPVASLSYSASRLAQTRAHAASYAPAHLCHPSIRHTFSRDLSPQPRGALHGVQQAVSDGLGWVAPARPLQSKTLNDDTQEQTRGQRQNGHSHIPEQIRGFVEKVALPAVYA